MSTGTDIAVLVREALDDVARIAHGACEETLDAISKEALKIAKENAPVSTPNGGNYKKSLKRTKLKTDGEVSGYRIHSTESISHLLENGHLTRNGSMTVPGKKHFLPAQEYAADAIEQEFQKNYQKGES